MEKEEPGQPGVWKQAEFLICIALGRILMMAKIIKFILVAFTGFG
jgi:hypothetical protein